MVDIILEFIGAFTVCYFIGKIGVWVIASVLYPAWTHFYHVLLCGQYEAKFTRKDLQATTTRYFSLFTARGAVGHSHKIRDDMARDDGIGLAVTSVRKI